MARSKKTSKTHQKFDFRIEPLFPHDSRSLLCIRFVSVAFCSEEEDPTYLPVFFFSEMTLHNSQVYYPKVRIVTFCCMHCKRCSVATQFAIFTLPWHSPAMKHKKTMANIFQWKIDIDFFDFLGVICRLNINIRIEVHFFVCIGKWRDTDCM